MNKGCCVGGRIQKGFIVMKKKVISVLLTGILAVGMTACSWSKDAVKMHAESSSSASLSASRDQTPVTGTSSTEAVPSVAANSTSGNSENVRSASDGGETSASVSAQDGLNISGEGEAGREEKLQAAFEKCVGWGGSAGSALKSAAAAVSLVEWAADSKESEAELADTVKAAWAKMSDEQKENFRENWRGISTNANLMFSDFASVKGVLGDSGVLEQASEAVAKQDAQQKWEVLQKSIADCM